MKSIMAALALTLVLSAGQNVEAKNPAKGGGGGGSPPPSNSRALGALTVDCSLPNSTASAKFVNDPSLGYTVQLKSSNGGFASTSITNLENSLVTLLGSINFSATGDINNNNFVVTAYTIPAGDTNVLTTYLTFPLGSIQKGSATNSYFIGMKDKFGNFQLPSGGRLVGLRFSNNNAGTANNKIYNVSLTAFGPVGFDLNSPSQNCDSTP